VADNLEECGPSWIKKGLRNSLGFAVEILEVIDACVYIILPPIVFMI